MIIQDRADSVPPLVRFVAIMRVAWPVKSGGLRHWWVEGYGPTRELAEYDLRRVIAENS